MIVGARINQKYYSHSGGTNSFLCIFYIYPESYLAFFVIANACDQFCTLSIINLFGNIEKLLLLDF